MAATTQNNVVNAWLYTRNYANYWSYSTSTSKANKTT